MPNFWVNCIVATRDKMPYLQLSNDDGLICQMSLAEARNVAHDILVMCSRTEADAMILKFFDKADFPPQAGAAMMLEFRDYRAALDQEIVERRQEDPDQ